MPSMVTLCVMCWDLSGYSEEERTSQRVSNQSAAVKIMMAISEPPAMFDLFLSTSHVCVFASLLLDLLDFGTNPITNFSLELGLVVLQLQILDGFSIIV